MTSFRAAVAAMSDYLALDASKIASEIQHLLASYPELAEDEDLRVDTLEGETDLHCMMSRLVRVRNEKLAAAKGLGGYIDELSERKARHTRSAEGVKALMLSLMSAADLPKLVLPEATVSVGKGRDAVDVTDIDALPQGFFVTERKADKEAIGAALKAGNEVPGAALRTGDAVLTVRIK